MTSFTILDGSSSKCQSSVLPAFGRKAFLIKIVLLTFTTSRFAFPLTKHTFINSSDCYYCRMGSSLHTTGKLVRELWWPVHPNLILPFTFFTQNGSEGRRKKTLNCKIAPFHNGSRTSKVKKSIIEKYLDQVATGWSRWWSQVDDEEPLTIENKCNWSKYQNVLMDGWRSNGRFY